MDAIVFFRMVKALGELRSHDLWSPTQLEAHQEAKLRQLRAYAYQHSAYYQQFHAGLYDRPLSELPVLTKSLVMDNFDTLVTVPGVRLADLQRLPTDGRKPIYRVAATSGSTGKPGLFIYNRREWAWMLASVVRAEQWEGLEIGLTKRYRVAVVASAMPRHISCMFNTNLRSPWSSTLGVSATAPIAAIVRQLNDWQPEVLSGFPSILNLLAGEQLAGRLSIQPGRVFTSGEVLNAEKRRTIERAWGTRPFDQYATTETGVLAAECEGGGMHLAEDLVIVENVDEANQPVSPENPGSKLLVTVLFNRSQPLIRYELSDQVTIACGKCACGRPFQRLALIEGRQEEILYFPGPEGADVPVHPNLFHRVMDLAAAGNWQLILRDDGLHVQLSGAQDSDTAARLEHALRDSLATQPILMPPIHVERVAARSSSASGKQPLVKSERSGEPTWIAGDN